MKEEDAMLVTLKVSELKKVIIDVVDQKINKLITPPEPKTYFNGLKDLARYLQSSEGYAAKVEKMLPPGSSYRAGRMLRIDRQAVEELIRQGKIR